MSKTQLFICDDLSQSDDPQRYHLINAIAGREIPLTILSESENDRKTIKRVNRRHRLQTYLEYLEELGPHLIHVSSLRCGAEICLAARQSLGIPFVYYLFRSDLYRWGSRRHTVTTLQKLCQEADAVIVDYAETKSVLDIFGIPHLRTLIAGPLVPDSLFQQRNLDQLVRSKYGLETSPIILSIGLKASSKSCFPIIDATLRLSAEFPGLCCIMISSTETWPVIDEQTRRFRTEDCFRVSVEPEWDELVTLMAFADVITVTTSGQADRSAEWLILAGAAMLKPALGDASGSNVEMIQDGLTGFLIDTTDPKMTFQKIHLLLSHDQLRRKLGSQARQWADRFRVSKRIEKIRSITEKILEGSDRT